MKNLISAPIVANAFDEHLIAHRFSLTGEPIDLTEIVADGIKSFLFAYGDELANIPVEEISDYVDKAYKEIDAAAESMSNVFFGD